MLAADVQDAVVLVRFQKHASRIIYNEDRTAHARPLMK